MNTLDVISMKHKFSCVLASDDLEVRHSAVVYMTYMTIKANEKLTVNSVKALLCSEYLLPETSIDAAIAGLISRSMFACVRRWRASGRPIGDTQVSVTEPPPAEFLEWLRRTEVQLPELKIFNPPIYQYKSRS